MIINRYEEKIREAASLLEELAKAFPAESREVEVLKRCALAYGFVVTRYDKDFESYVADLRRPPTDEELERIKQYEC